MDIIITDWALDSYLELYSIHVFTDDEYKKTIRPDARRLKSYPNDEKFKNGKFWSPATDPIKNRPIPDGYKMKWHNIGPGKVQLRLPVGMMKEAVLCKAYVKKNTKQERRMLAVFKTHLQLVNMGRFTERGRLP
jgi:hypothetical protein